MRADRMRTSSHGLGLLAAGVSLALIQGTTRGQTTEPGAFSEEALVERIKKLTEVDTSGVPDGQRLAIRQTANQQVVAEVDTLLGRYPKTKFRDEALIVELAALADLARLHAGYLERLLSQTQRIAKSDPSDRLASENAYYAIQAFVLGARAENMPDERRLVGTQERYEAFLADFPRSERVPVIRASLIRVLIAQGLVDRARGEFAELKRAYPTHQATRRAQGELYRVVAVGQRFSFGYVTTDGRSIRTTDYLGNVLIVHFWATWSQPSMEGIPELIDLHNEFKDRGLRLIGVNVDKDGKRVEQAVQRYQMPWPQYFDYRGLENELLVTKGVLKIPTYFVVDRRGVLRSIDPGDKFRSLLTELLGEPPPKP